MWEIFLGGSGPMVSGEESRVTAAREALQRETDLKALFAGMWNNEPELYQMAAFRVGQYATDKRVIRLLRAWTANDYFCVRQRAALAWGGVVVATGRDSESLAALARDSDSMARRSAIRASVLSAGDPGQAAEILREKLIRPYGRADDDDEDQWECAILVGALSPTDEKRFKPLLDICYRKADLHFPLAVGAGINPDKHGARDILEQIEGKHRADNDDDVARLSIIFGKARVDGWTEESMRRLLSGFFSEKATDRMSYPWGVGYLARQEDEAYEFLKQGTRNFDPFLGWGLACGFAEAAKDRRTAIEELELINQHFLVSDDPSIVSCSFPSLVGLFRLAEVWPERVFERACEIATGSRYVRHRVYVDSAGIEFYVRECATDALLAIVRIDPRYEAEITAVEKSIRRKRDRQRVWQNTKRRMDALRQARADADKAF